MELRGRWVLLCEPEQQHPPALPSPEEERQQKDRSRLLRTARALGLDVVTNSDSAAQRPEPPMVAFVWGPAWDDSCHRALRGLFQTQQYPPPQPPMRRASAAIPATLQLAALYLGERVEEILAAHRRAFYWLNGEHLPKASLVPDGRKAWAAAVRTMGEPGRLRELHDLVIAIAPDHLGQSAVAAALAVLRCRAAARGEFRDRPLVVLGPWTKIIVPNRSSTG